MARALQSARRVPLDGGRVSAIGSGRMRAADTLDVSAADNGVGRCVGAVAVAAAGAVVTGVRATGPLSGHMVVHIASMNVVAPLVAVGSAATLRSFARDVGWHALACDAGPAGAALGVA